VLHRVGGAQNDVRAAYRFLRGENPAHRDAGPSCISRQNASRLSAVGL
jgi:hypothetical protein